MKRLLRLLLSVPASLFRLRSPMRRLLTVFALTAGTLCSAFAADYDLPLPRSQPPATFTRWSGFYFGGNISLGTAMSDFSRATQPLVASSLQGTLIENQEHLSGFQILGRGSAVAAGGGAFLGYNMPQLRPDLVLGV